MKRRMIVAALALAACAAPADSALPSAPTSDVTPSTQAIDMTMEATAVATTMPAPTTTEAIAAMVTETAVRDTMAQVTETLPPPSARDICNSQVYGRQLEPPAEACFRAVTFERGWTQAMTDAWVPFAITADNGILYGESEHCPLRRAGDIEADDCRILECSNGSPPWGVNSMGQAYCTVGSSDIGFGQATSVWYKGGDKIACRDYGYCSVAQILDSPHDSMLVTVVLLIEVAGSDPWCFSARSIRYHRCNAGHVPDR